jgi:uncharacterized delta-60 repeat protein
MSRPVSTKFVVVLLSPLALLVSGTSAAPGDLDATFGAAGIVTTDFFGYDDFAAAVAVQPDGKIVVAGSARSGTDAVTTDFAVSRYNPDGTLDSDFGNGGRVTTDIVESTDYGHGVAIQADGKIIVVGEATTAIQTSFALVRYLDDGRVDESFGTDGKVITTFSSQYSLGYEIVVQADQKIVVAGTTAPSLSSFLSDFALARYNSDGSLDPTFGLGGIVITDFFSFSDGARSLVQQRDGKLIAAGFTATAPGGQSDFALARYYPDGTLDTTFGPNGDGKVSTDFSGDSDQLQSITLQRDGAIVVAGFIYLETGENNFGFALARYGADGILDPGFGANGKVTTDLNLLGDLVASVVVQPDGKILAGGYANFQISSQNLDLALVRYNRDGSLDSGFGNNGIVISDLSPGFDIISAMVLQADGKLIAAGSTGSTSDFLVARYLTDVSGTTPQALNMSTRALVGTGENVLIGGFIVTGSDSKIVLLRALGPSLMLGDATPLLVDPILELHAPNGTLITNDSWADTQEEEILNTGLNPADPRESAILTTLGPGPYTVTMRGKDNGIGVGLVEIYDLDTIGTSKLANVSSRGSVGTGDNVMIAGVILSGENNAIVVLRGLGPSLGQFGITDSLQDPTLDLYDANGTLTASDDNWRELQEAALQASGLAPTDDREAALLVELAAGAYTAVLRGNNESTGVGLIEAYNLQ